MTKLLRTDNKDSCWFFLHKWYAISTFVINLGSSTLPLTTTVSFQCLKCSARKEEKYRGRLFINWGQVSYHNHYAE